MSEKVYVYGLCNVFYDSYYIQGLREVYSNYEFNVSKFPALNQGVFAFIIENNKGSKKIIIDSNDSNEIDDEGLKWADVYGKVNYNLDNLSVKNSGKIVAIGPSFGIKIWNFPQTFFYLILNFIRFRNYISNKKEFAANYWRQYKRLELKEYQPTQSSINEIFFMNSIWKQESETNKNRSLFIESCKSNPKVYFEGGFAARSNGDNLGFDSLVYSKKIPLKVYIRKIKNSAIVFNTPAVLSCHGWKLAEFLALGKAIITTSHFNKLPSDLLNKKHLMYAEDAEEIKLIIEKVITNIDFKRNLESESKNYFDEYLAPKKVITRLIENI